MLSNILSILTTTSLLFSFSMRSAKQEDNKFDYELKTRFEKEKVFYIDIEKERENGNYFTNAEFMLMKEWKHFLLRGKTINIESKSLDIKEVNLLGRYNNYYTGIVCLWENNIPKQAVKIGVEYSKGVNLLLSQPQISIKAFTLTNDFKRFNNEFSGIAKFNLFSFGKSAEINFVMESNLYQYDKLDWRYKTHIEFSY